MKSEYKLCWACNRKFRGKYKTKVFLKQSKLPVLVHKICAEEMKEDGVILEIPKQA